MDLFEYQSRDLFARYGVAVLEGQVADSPQQAGEIARRLLEARPASVVVVKAQVKTGGRGKAGGIKIARTASEAEAAAGQILGMDIKGHQVRQVMVTVGADITEEFYFSILLDRASGGYLALCSRQGGMDIEQIARDHPEALVTVQIDPRLGLDTATAAQIVDAAGFSAALREDVITVIQRLWAVFEGEDASLVEVNPLALTSHNHIHALDGKITLDDNASRIRHPHHLELVDEVSSDPLENRAKASGLGYVKLDGQVGIIGNGAGLVMSTLDLVADAGAGLPAGGGRRGIGPANFLDIGGGASATVMAEGLSIILSDPQVASVYINVFGGITACDAVALGVLEALDRLEKQAAAAGAAPLTVPLVVRLDGNNVQAGRAILAKANHPLITVAQTMDAGATLSAQLASQQLATVGH